MANLSDDIAETLTRAVVAKRLPPGTKLSEQVLADLFGVSRAVIRQAIIRLSDEGLLTMERNRGAFVTRPTIREAIEMYDALTIIEQGVAAQLAGRLDHRGWAELRDHIAQQTRAVEDKNHVLADNLGAGFHTAFVAILRNKIVQDMHLQLVRRTALLRSLVDSRFDYCGLVNDHVRIVDLLEAGDVRAAQALIDTHYRNVVKGFLMDAEEPCSTDVRPALLPLIEEKAAAKLIAAK